MTGSGEPSGVRLSELLGVLSFGADLGMGQPMEHVLRQCMLSLGLADQLALSIADREAVHLAALVAWVGCHVDSYEAAKWFGDETALAAISGRWTSPRLPRSGRSCCAMSGPGCPRTVASP